MRCLVLWINIYRKQQTENNKTQGMFSYLLKTVTSSSKFFINITHLNESEALITVMSELFFFWSFSLGHVIITTIIIKWEVWNNTCESVKWVSDISTPVYKCEMRFPRASDEALSTDSINRLIPQTLWHLFDISATLQWPLWIVPGHMSMTFPVHRSEKK